MSKKRTKTIGAYLNSRMGKVGKTMYGFIKREVKTRELPSGKRQIIRKPKEDAVIATDKDGYFEFQDTPENREFAYKLIMNTKKGIPKIELDDLDLQDEIIGEVIRMYETKDLQEEETTVELDPAFTPRFSPKKASTQAQRDGAANARAAKVAKALAKKQG